MKNIDASEVKKQLDEIRANLAKIEGLTLKKGDDSYDVEASKINILTFAEFAPQIKPIIDVAVSVYKGYGINSDVITIDDLISVIEFCTDIQQKIGTAFAPK